MEEIEKLCRICMADYEESTSLYAIVDKNKISETKAGIMFNKCLNLEVLPNSGYPKEICNHCNLQISVFFNFMTMAKKSHDKFTTKLNVIKNLKVEEININQELLNMLEEDQSSENDEKEKLVGNSDNEAAAEEVLDEEAEGGGEEEEEEEETYMEVVDKLNETEEESQDWPSEADNEEYQIEYLEEELDIKKEYEEPLADTVDYYETSPETTQEVIDKLYSCKHCDEISDSKKDHVNHLKTHKLPNILKLTCHLCDKKFKNQGIFDGHLKVHEGLPAYSCEHCKKTFNFKNNYQTHILLHTNERPFPCTLCEKSFRSNWDLTVHTRVHNDIRKYECNICGKKFRVSSHMTSHKYTHFSKSFECDICFNKYISPRTLKQHKSTVHSDEAPYQCTFGGCPKKFKRKHHVDNHRKTHDTKVQLVDVLTSKIANDEARVRSNGPSDDDFEDDDDELMCEMVIT